MLAACRMIRCRRRQAETNHQYDKFDQRHDCIQYASLKRTKNSRKQNVSRKTNNDPGNSCGECPGREPSGAHLLARPTNTVRIWSGSILSHCGIQYAQASRWRNSFRLASFPPPILILGSSMRSALDDETVPRRVPTAYLKPAFETAC